MFSYELKNLLKVVWYGSNITGAVVASGTAYTETKRMTLPK